MGISLRSDFQIQEVVGHFNEGDWRGVYDELIELLITKKLSYAGYRFWYRWVRAAYDNVNELNDVLFATDDAEVDALHKVYFGRIERCKTYIADVRAGKAVPGSAAFAVNKANAYADITDKDSLQVITPASLR